MKKLAVLLMAILLIAALSACGSKSDKAGSAASDNAGQSAASGDAQTLEIHAKNFQFDKPEYDVKAGDVNVKFVIDENIHGLRIKGTDVNFTKAGEKTVNLKPGTYDIECSIPCGSGHLNMKSKIVAQ